MTDKTRHNALGTALALALVLLLAGLALIVLLPRPREIAEADSFSCDWEDGTSSETLSSVLPYLAGVSSEGVLLERNGTRGLVRASECLAFVVGTLEGGTLLELLTLDGSDLTPLEQLAVEKFYGERAYYDGEPFAWDGTRVSRTERTQFSEVVLLAGSFSGNFLLDSGAQTLYLTEESEIGENDLLYSLLTHVVAPSSYFLRGGELWESVLGVGRFVAYLPAGCTFETA